MSAAYEIMRALSLLAFLFYGGACVFTGSMEAEFERYGMPHMRVLVGSLELLGALGLLAGYFYAPLVAVASGGLCLLMVLAVATRVRIGDSFVEALPALTLCLCNAFIFAVAVIGRRAAHSVGS
ncbi:MAG: DoxX family protein [Planctomycetota bacterium]|nr:DoxX family protein [Planctomycetota bacterium]MEC8651810.1 DoxX family protein [Planctomycetota bacterium]MEC9049130.1 DoxX family protein [Planctomycetota bacterium]